LNGYVSLLSSQICFYDFFFSLKWMNVTEFLAMGSHVQTGMELIKAVYGSLKERIFVVAFDLSVFLTDADGPFAGECMWVSTHTKKSDTPSA